MSLFIDLLFSAIGSAYLMYGRRQFNSAFLIAGVILMFYPYFVSNVMLCSVIGLVLVAAPFIAQKIG